MSVELKGIKPKTDTNTGDVDDTDITVSIPTNGVENKGYQDGDNEDDTKQNYTELTRDRSHAQEDETSKPSNSPAAAIQNAIGNFYSTNSTIIKYIIYMILFILYVIYLGFAIDYEFGSESSYRLLIGSVIVFVFIVLRILFGAFDEQIEGRILAPGRKTFQKPAAQKFSTVLFYALSVGFAAFVVIYVIVDVGIHTPRNLVSAAGLAAFVFLFYIFSNNPAEVKWRPVYWGLAIQFIFALLILRWEVGFDIFDWIGMRVTEFLAHTDAGAKFIFGDLYMNHFFAFKVLPIVIFFSTVISMLYYLGVMQFVIRYIGRFLSFCLGTSPAESLNAAGNIFIGQSEAPLMIRPFLKDMTASELHAICTGGMATIAGSVLATYISFGVPANHLLTASVMSAPAALAMSKLFYPETELVRAKAKDVYNMAKATELNLIEAASSGASQSIKLVANIAVNLIAFISLLAFLNATLTWFGNRVGQHDPPLTCELIFSYVFYPLSFLMGVDTDNCLLLGELIGIKTFVNEFVAYRSLSCIIENRKKFESITESIGWNGTGTQPWVTYTNGTMYFEAQDTYLIKGYLSRRSEAIATYALCGFSNIGSMGVMLGALGAMAPNQKSTLSKIILRSMIAANVACFMTACIAGLLYDENIENRAQTAMLDLPWCQERPGDV